MSEKNTSKNWKTRFNRSLIACFIIGITFIISGTGKLFEFGVVPGQTLDFIGFILPESWLNEATLSFLDVLIAYIVPSAELAIGILLLIGFGPRLLAVLVMLLSLVFMANNIFSLYIGMDIYPHCSCFGIWGKIFGTITPVQSLCFDIVLFVLALIIIIATPLPFFSSRKWLANLGKKKKQPETEGN